MSITTPLFAAALLLILPGPTNALVAAATATGGVKRLPTALAAVLGAYALSLTLLGLASHLLAETLPVAAPILKLCAAGLLGYSAVKLWRASPTVGVAVPTLRIAMITLINPKALVLAFAILPPGLPSPALAIGLAAVVAGATALWGALGLILGRLGRHYARGDTVNKVTAAVLAGFSATVMVTVAVSPL